MKQDIHDLVDRLQKTRPLLAGYLAGAKSMRKDGNRVVFIFDDAHFAQPLIDAKATIEEIASDVFGAPIELIVETATKQTKEERVTEDKPGALRDDPVVKAFAKHLGGEIVEPRKR